MLSNSFYRIVILSTLTACSAFAEPPSNTKPPARPEAAQLTPEQIRRQAEAMAEAERSKAYSEVVNASRDADLARAAFEKQYRPGPLTKENTEQFDQMIATFQKAVSLPNSSPDVLKTLVYTHMRLAGAYQYVHQTDKCITQIKKAIEISVGTESEIEATYNLGVTQLQSLHDPKAALDTFKNVQNLLKTVTGEPAEMAKWNAAVTEVMARCEKEMKGKP